MQTRRQRRHGTPRCCGVRDFAWWGVRETREETALDVSADKVLGERAPATGRHTAYVAYRGLTRSRRATATNSGQESSSAPLARRPGRPRSNDCVPISAWHKRPARRIARPAHTAGL